VFRPDSSSQIADSRVWPDGVSDLPGARARLKHKGAWALAVVLAQAINLSALWAGSPVAAEAMLALGAVTTALIGLMALYSSEPALAD
jgi:hypothetical protein